MSVSFDEPRKWSRKEPKGIHFLTVRRHIKKFLQRQRGCQVTISKVRIHLKKTHGLILTFDDIHDFMLNLGAHHIEQLSSLVNPYIYDISECKVIENGATN
jgi:hypothetical protein